MLPAYSHVPMRIGYLSEANDSHVRLLEVTVFANTSFTFPPGSFPEHRPLEIFSSGISLAQLLYYTDNAALVNAAPVFDTRS